MSARGRGERSVSAHNRGDLSTQIDKLLSMLNAKIVMQVCGNFALKEELGELTQELNDKRAAEHRKLIEEATQQIKQLIESSNREARIEAADHCIQLQLGTKTNDFDTLYNKLKAYKDRLKELS